MSSSLLPVQGKSTLKVRLLFSSLCSPFLSQGGLDTEQGEKVTLAALKALMLGEAPKGRASTHQNVLTMATWAKPRFKKAVESVLFPMMEPADMLHTFVKQG